MEWNTLVEVVPAEHVTPRMRASAPGGAAGGGMVRLRRMGRSCHGDSRGWAYGRRGHAPSSAGVGTAPDVAAMAAAPGDPLRRGESLCLRIRSTRCRLPASPAPPATRQIVSARQLLELRSGGGPMPRRKPARRITAARAVRINQLPDLEQALAAAAASRCLVGLSPGAADRRHPWEEYSPASFA